jgi:phytoene desaturase
MPEKIIIIGAGFSGLSAACELASRGFDVTVIEKNEQAGGRASVFSAEGFTFDMGPSWYWMPDVFEWFFEQYGKQVTHLYELKRLDPGYRVFFGKDDVTDIPASREALNQLFENLEPGSSKKLTKFLQDAAYKYKVGMKDLVFRPCNSIFEFADIRLLKALLKMQLFTSLRKEVQAKFKHEKIRKLLEFPVYFLGALPSNTPALYSILNYADLVLGTWYPMGGMYKIVEAMQKTAESLGVRFIFNAPVESIVTENKKATAVKAGGHVYNCDAVIASADYRHVEQNLLQNDEINYDERYWGKKTFAPSCLIFYLGIQGKIEGLLHHNLFFDESFDVFAQSIYTKPHLPENPLFYVSAPSKTDVSIAPAGHENLFILIPLAPGIVTSHADADVYFEKIITRIETHVSMPIRHRIVYRKDFAPQDFIARYNAYKGNAYGLANTLLQTAVFKPKMHNKQIKNLVYAGQLTVPGPGVPPSIISGHIAAKEIAKIFN